MQIHSHQELTFAEYQNFLLKILLDDQCLANLYLVFRIVLGSVLNKKIVVRLDIRFECLNFEDT